VIGNDTAITIGGMQGQFELNVRAAHRPQPAQSILPTTAVTVADTRVAHRGERTGRSIGSRCSRRGNRTQRDHRLRRSDEDRQEATARRRGDWRRSKMTEVHDVGSTCAPPQPETVKPMSLMRMDFAFRVPIR
jgi:hypothetical protein